MTIEEIYYSEDISVRSFNVCNDNGLKDLAKILKHYQKYKTFNNLRNCGGKSNEELIKLCLKYINVDILYANEILISKSLFSKIEPNLSDIQIEEINNSILNNSKSLSVRSKNSIRFFLRGNLDIRNIYEKILSDEDFSIHKLRSVGKSSIPEIIQFIESIKNELFQISNFNVDNNQFSKPQNPIITIISNFTRTQREIVNSFIEINSNNLSNRSKNAITSFLNGNLKIRNISEKILINELFNIYHIRNVGAKSVKELTSFIDSIKEFILKVSSVANENDLIVLKNKFFIEKTFSISTIPDEIIESQSIFKLIDFLLNSKLSLVDSKTSIVNAELLIVDTHPHWQSLESNSSLKSGENNIIFNKNISLIFQKALKIYNEHPQLTLDEIAKNLNISRERVRQLKKICIAQLYENLKFIKNIDDDLFQKYGIDINQDFLIIDENIKNVINEINNTNFSIEFISFLIYVYASDKFELIGNIEDVLEPKSLKSRNRHNWVKFYVVSRRISEEFEFNAFADDLENRLSERNEETYSLNLKSYLINFLKNEKTLILPILSMIAENIINQEFEIFIDLNDSMVFKQNTFIQVSKCAINVLEKLGIPSKLEDIYKLIENDFPEITKSQDALRGSLQRSPEIIYFGRSSTYGLKKWEIEKEGIKGGTIKDIIFEYLQDNNDPIHILELLNEVHKYRDKTNAKNIITNLKLDPQKLFIIFNQSFIGLSGKTYNSNLTVLPKFLGKTVTNYVNQQKFTNRITVEEYFSFHLKISQRNMKYIIDYLIEQQFVFIDNQNNLSI